MRSEEAPVPSRAAWRKRIFHGWIVTGALRPLVGEKMRLRSLAHHGAALGTALSVGCSDPGGTVNQGPSTTSSSATSSAGGSGNVSSSSGVGDTSSSVGATSGSGGANGETSGGAGSGIGIGGAGSGIGGGGAPARDAGNTGSDAHFDTPTGMSVGCGKPPGTNSATAFTKHDIMVSGVDPAFPLPEFGSWSQRNYFVKLPAITTDEGVPRHLRRQRVREHRWQRGAGGDSGSSRTTRIKPCWSG